MEFQYNTIEEAIAAFKLGKIILVTDDEGRENEGDLIASAELITPESIAFMAIHARGLICAPISKDIAERLDIGPMVSTNTDSLETAFTVSVDHVDTTTGISARDRALTIKQLADFSSKPSDFRRPGHIFPLIAKSKGVLERTGHTEATVDLAKLAGLTPAGVCCEIMLDNGEMARTPDLIQFAKEHDLVFITVAQLVEYRKRHEQIVHKIAEADFPNKFGHFRLHAFETDIDDKCHLAIVKGDVLGKENVLTRIHSECLTGDVLGSMRCDCGEQLAYAMEHIEAAGCGILLYLRQEGRGIGLANKLRAYEIQDSGKNTIEANVLLGFKPDMRDYTIGAQILEALGVKSVNLLTNNPTKAEGLRESGMIVNSLVPIKMHANEHDRDYLEIKKEQMGHLL